MPRSIDILGLGGVAIDDLVFVEEYPPVDTKRPIIRREQHCGGLTASALVAASRLGVSTSYCGPLGSDAHSQMVLDVFRNERIDVQHVYVDTDARPVQAIVIIDERANSRTLLYDMSGVRDAPADWPPQEVVESAKIVFVDDFSVEAMVRAATIARSHGRAVVADFEHDSHPSYPQLLQLVDHLIVSRDFALRTTEKSTIEAAINALWTSDRQLVAVTDGANGCSFRTPETPLDHFPAFSVNAVDTTGCGDVFHGAYMVALLRGEDTTERIRFASAAAAIKATQIGGQLGSPTHDQVVEFLAERTP